MSFYKSPVRPYDPVIEDDKDSQASRYYRDSFDATGQDSRTNPPGQDQSLWEALTNVMPITRAGLDRRRGYSVFSQDLSVPAFSRLFSFQRDTDGLRAIVGANALSIDVFNEDGSNYGIGGPFTPLLPPRMVNSRSYGYFFSGAAADQMKWDGTAPAGTFSGQTKWGIAFPTTIATLNAGPNGASAASGWFNSDKALVQDGVFATTTLPAGITNSVNLAITGFGFAIPTTATILGITAFFRGRCIATDTGGCTRILSMGLLKNNVYIGGQRGVVVPTGATNGSYLNGASTDLWNSSWLPSEINAPGFGVFLQGVTNGLGHPGAATWGIDGVSIIVAYQASPQAIAVANGGGGSVTLTVGRIYYYVFQNSGTGHYSDLSPASASTGPLTSNQVNLSGIAVSSDTQVDSKTILATTDGGDPSELFYVATIPNSQTTYTDNTDEATLDLNQVYQFTDAFGNDFGVAGNTPPPNGTVCVKHKGRLWMAVGQNLYYSKSVADLTLPNGFIAGKYEEAWPQDTFLDISEGAETVQGLLSNGQALFIGTQRHIRWVTGDDPTNFSEPEVVHAEVGLLNQEVWQNVFVQGTPSGCIWLSPDFRVIGSDFNSYHDIGHPIQDILDTINPSAAQSSHAMFVDDGEFDLYILAIPTGSNTSCDTHCIFNMRSQQWVVWTPTNPSLSMLFNVTSTGVPQWLFAGNTLVYQYLESATNDNGTSFLTTARTSWLHLGAPTHRKLLEELEVIGDPNMKITVEGASPQGDFTGGNINSYKSAVAPIISPFKQLKVYLATSGTKDRYYRFTFTSNFTDPVFHTNPPFLRSYNIKSIPFNSI